MTASSTSTVRGDKAPAATQATFLTLDRVYVLAALAVVVAAALSTVVRPHDFWWHLANGRSIVETGSFPTVDTFTYTQSGEPFFNQMWLAQVVMYALYRAGGVPLVVVGHAAAIGAAYAMLLRLCIRLTGRARLSALLLLIAVLPLSFSNWAVRPQPYAFPLFVAFLAVLVYDHRWSGATARRLWILPVLMALWVNIHGSFVLGLGLVTLAVVVEVATALRDRGDGQSDHVKQLVLVAAATWAASLLNPRGIGALSYVVRLTTNDSVASVSEWQPLGLSDVASGLYYVVGVVVILAFIYSRRRPPVIEVLATVGFLFLGVTAQRHTTWFALAAAPALAMQAAALLKPPRQDPGLPVMNAVLAAMMGLAVVAALPWSRAAVAPPPLDRTIAETPVEATAALANLDQPPDRLFNDLGYGSYIAYALPTQKTFIDTRFELFPAAQVEDYRALTNGRDFEAMVEKYDFDAFLVSRKYQPALIEHLLSEPEFALEHSDSEALLFVREP